MARRGPFLPVDIAEAAIADTTPKPFALPDYYTPDVPDAAPNVEGWTPNQPDPRDPYGIRAPYVGPPAGTYDAASSPGETLRNVAGVFNPFSENSVFGSFYQGENPVLQELARPSNYIGAGGGVRGLARGALSGIGGRVAGELAMEAVPEDAPEPLRIAAGLVGGLAGGVAGFRAIDDVPRIARTTGTWMEAADNALAEASGATEAAIRRQAPEAFQFGRVPETDELFTFGPQGERVGPTGAVREIRLGREPRMGENVNAGLRYTNLGRAEMEQLAEADRAAFQSAYDRSIAGAERGIAGGAGTTGRSNYIAPDGSVVGGGIDHDAIARSLLGVGRDAPTSYMNPTEHIDAVLNRGYIRSGIANGEAYFDIVGTPTPEQVSAMQRYVREANARTVSYDLRSDNGAQAINRYGWSPEGFTTALRADLGGGRASDVQRFRGPSMGGGADLTPADFARLAAKKAAGEALTPDEQDSVLQALGKAMGASTADEQAIAREALYNGPVPTDMREVDTGLIEGVRGRLGAPTGRTVEDALKEARAGENPDVQAAIQKFGLTNNVEDAGFVLPDGRMLDFKHGSSTADGLLEHESVAEAWWNRARDGRLSAEQAQNEMLGFMEDSGALRIGYGKRIAQFGTDAVTPEQRRVLGKMVSEITENGRNPYASVSVEFPDGTYGNVHNASELGALLDPRMKQPSALDALGRARQVEQGAPEGDVLAARIPNPLPMPVRARNTAAAEAGQRVGNLLRPRGLEQLGPDATVSDVIGVAQDTRRMVESQQIALSSRAKTYVDALGPTVKDGAGNYRLRTVIKADGAPALLQDVLENPARYPLTPEQAKAVADYQALVQMVRDEPRTFGVKVRTTGLEDGQSYIPRQAAADTKGNALEARGGGAAGARLRSMREKGRVFRDPEQAARAGVVYEHPLTAFQSYVRQNLEGAANQHIASMLKTFGETSAQRVPAPLRAAHDGLMKSLQSLRQTAGRLDERALETVEAHIASGADDLNALAADLNDIVVRGSGRNAGKDARAVRAEIARIKQQIADMRPAWNRAQEQARQVPAGRARVDQNAAPALIGTDFAEKDARRISRYYANGILPQNAIGDVLRGAAKVNRAIIPMQAIGDASATLRQLGTVLPSHPITFAKNFGNAARDLFPGGQARYREWLASPEVQDAASRGLALVGEGGVPNDFHASWFSRVPGLKQAQQHFEMISNRNRVDIFNQDVDMMRRTGQRVDDAAMEQVARNANRITGVANNRATDAETLTEFAANWMRSRLETLTKAVADGGIEGQLARGYLKNYVSTGLIAAGAAAMAQGRDVREVLNPIQERNGRFSYNPNFGTVRVGGVDVDMFSSYSDLARLAVMAADAGYGALTERDLTELAKPLIYAARTKGAPWLSTSADVATGENIVGDPVNSWTYWLTKPIPINAAVAVRNEQEGKPFLPSVAEGVAQFFGSRANQLTPTERVQQGEYGQMSPQQQFKAIPAQAWRIAVEQAPEQYKAVARYDSASAFYQALVDEYTQGWIERGASPLEAEAKARASAARHPVYRAFQNARNYYENQWTAQNPEQRQADAEAQLNLQPSERRNMPREQERRIIQEAMR